MSRRAFLLIGGLVLIVVLALGSVLLGRNGTTTPTETKLSIWLPFDEVKTYKDIAADFLKSNPKVTLDVKYIKAADAKEYEATVVDAIASGKGPDIWLIRTDWLPKHQPKLASSQVSWATTEGQTDVAGLAAVFGQAVADQNSRDGQLYGVPFGVDSLALIINKSLVSKAQSDLDDSGHRTEADSLGTEIKTWSQVANFANLLTKKSGSTITQSGLAVGTLNNTYAPTDVFLAMLAQQGGSLFSDDEKTVALHLAAVKDNKTVFPGQQALSTYSSYSDPTATNYAWSESAGDAEELFAKGKVAGLIGYSSLAQSLAKKMDDSSGVTVVPLPQLTDTGTRVDYAAYWTNVVSKTSSNQKLAWQLLKSLTSREAQVAYGKATNKPLPGEVLETKIANSSALDENTIFTAQVGTSQVIYKPEWQKTDEILQSMIHQKVTLSQSVTTVIDSAAEALKELVAE